MKSWPCLLVAITLLMGYVTPALPASLQAKPSTGASVTLSPDTVAASGVEWKVQIVLPYCGGYQIGRYVVLRFEPPFTLPLRVLSEAVSFDDGPAVVIRKGNTLQIAPAPGRVWSMVCGVRRPLDIVLSKALGLANPAKPGSYSIEVSTEADPKPVLVPVVVRPAGF